MQKKSRFLTGLLSAVMALTLFALPATATGEEGANTANPVWTRTTGSITIHKYEWNGNTKGPNATGEGDMELPTEVEGENVKKPTPLKDATFTIYKVKDENWLKEYYSYNTANPATTKFDFTKWDKYAEKKGNAYALKSDTELTTAGVDKPAYVDEQITNENGLANFSSLQLGLYLVIETKAPDSVTTACVPFFVSIPMTKGDGSRTNALQDWLYDVHVYPKNSTSYGDALLQKVGKTSGDDTEIKGMQGYQFKLYKKQTGGSWIQITKLPKNGVDNEGDFISEGEEGILTTDNDGQVKVSGLSNGVYAFVETGVNAKDGYILDSGIAYVFKINNNTMEKATQNDVTADTYPVGTTSFDFDSFNDQSTAQVKVTNYKPDFKKEITKRDGTTAAANDADYAIGDKVPYTLTVNIPENVDKLYTFKVSDEVNSSELVWDANSLVVKGIKDGENQESKLIEGTDYSLTKNGSADDDKNGFTIDFIVNKNGGTNTVDNYKNGTITISYKAELKPGADMNTTGNINKADLKYSNKTNITSEADDKPYDIHDEAVVYTFKIGILKKNDDGETMTGVEFTLYKKYDEKNDKAYADEDSNEPIGVVFKDVPKPFLSNDEAYNLGLNVSKGSTDKWFAVEELRTNNGAAAAKGLPNGTYKLVETKTNKGYNLLSGPVDATLSINYVTTKVCTTSFDENGKIIKHSENKKTTFNDNEKYDYTDIIIINRKGFNLPTTGGFGTLLFSGIGALLVVGGVGVLMGTKKKKDNA